ncbi:hypothetical protein RFI_31445 [Reticulomyxa filosa]|uniref:Transmembrane protein n=1 Tax=Reticulomyxa filosa TaxID=46433 RepID=X6LVK3_RETFI|nr:hypothetical protein RFI_31445 [Reticulomyxa filosa]|eukprot:ETO05948.1 hypothetical protein RFI_31445 [Reticulomyxa filosa]
MTYKKQTLWTQLNQVCGFSFGILLTLLYQWNAEKINNNTNIFRHVISEDFNTRLFYSFRIKFISFLLIFFQNQPSAYIYFWDDRYQGAGELGLFELKLQKITKQQQFSTKKQKFFLYEWFYASQKI